MDKRQFMDVVRRRLGPEFAASPDLCVRAVFHALHARLDPGQAGHIEAHLPKELKDDWELEPTGISRVLGGSPAERMDREEFLERVRSEAGLPSAIEAQRATEAVFAALRMALPAKDVRDTADELPAGLRELWLSSPGGEQPPA